MSRRELYFVMQKLIGLLLLVLSGLAVVAADCDVTICLITVPIGLMLIFTKDMVIVNDYFFEMERKKRSRRL